jgi:hypothetical protein
MNFANKKNNHRTTLFRGKYTLIAHLWTTLAFLFRSLHAKKTLQENMSERITRLFSPELSEQIELEKSHTCPKRVAFL